MKTMKIEKQLLFTDNVKRVMNLQVKDKLEYQKEAEGTHAVGFLYIQGEYENELQQQQSFQETLELDVLAPTHKLSKEAFYLDVAQYDGQVDDGGVTVTVLMQIHGLQEEDALKDSSIAQTKEKCSSLEQIPMPTKEEIANVEEDVERKKEHTNVDEFEDLFEDAGTTYVSYRMVVANANDTYNSLAQRYEVEEEDLAKANNHKEIMAKTLVILP